MSTHTSDRGTSLLSFDTLVFILRASLAAVLFMGGVKLAFPGDALGLAAAYVDPDTGWIAPFFVDQIENRLGMEVHTFLAVQGWLEMAVAVLLALGVRTRTLAVVAGLMFWAFAVANPVVGEIRLSRDIALAALSFAVAVGGPGRWTLEGRLRGWERGEVSDLRKRATLLVVRSGLAFTLISSALFTSGVMATHLNQTLPVVLVLLLGLALAAGVLPRWAAALVVLWMLGIVVWGVASSGLLGGLDSTKREVGLAAGAFLYALAGSRDPWVLFPGRRSSS